MGPPCSGLIGKHHLVPEEDLELHSFQSFEAAGQMPLSLPRNPPGSEEILSLWKKEVQWVELGSKLLSESRDHSRPGAHLPPQKALLISRLRALDP